MVDKDKLTEKAKGVAKEAAGSFLGDDDKEQEGKSQQSKAEKKDQADKAEQEAQQKRQEAAGKKGEQKKAERGDT